MYVTGFDARTSSLRGVSLRDAGRIPTSRDGAGYRLLNQNSGTTPFSPHNFANLTICRSGPRTTCACLDPAKFVRLPGLGFSLRFGLQEAYEHSFLRRQQIYACQSDLQMTNRPQSNIEP